MTYTFMGWRWGSLGLRVWEKSVVEGNLLVGLSILSCDSWRGGVRRLRKGKGPRWVSALILPCWCRGGGFRISNLKRGLCIHVKLNP